MFKRILVPLDGSERAEQAIPVATSIARVSGGTVILLQVATMPLDFAWQSMEASLNMPEALFLQQSSIKEYLATLAATKELEGVATITAVAEGVPAEAILSVASSQQVDLIVMCSHGRTGFKRWMLGSVAQKVARHSPVPVLVLRKGAGVPTNIHPLGMRPVRVLVTLDGSALSESALLPAATLTAVLSAPLDGELHLLRVLTMPVKEDAEHHELITAEKAQAIAAATAYLKMLQQRMQEGDEAVANIKVTTSVIVDTDIAGAVIGAAEMGEGMEEVEGFQGCDVIAMATHGRGGLEHWIMGSVTERVLHATRMPLLIIRSKKTEARHEVAGVASGSKNHKEDVTGTAPWMGLL